MSFTICVTFDSIFWRVRESLLFFQQAQDSGARSVQHSGSLPEASPAKPNRNQCGQKEDFVVENGYSELRQESHVNYI